MKANEFIKKFGLGEAKALLTKHEKSFMPRVFDMWSDELQDFVLAEKYASFDMDDLKRLVESHDLVESYGGLEKSKLKVQGNRLSYKRLALLSKAIADVESCQ